VLALEVTDHFGAGAGALTGVDPPVPDVAAGARPVDRVMTGRDDTSDDTLAADPGPPEAPDTACLFDELDDVVEEPVDAPPRPEWGSPSEEDDEDPVPESACATTGAASDAPSATVNAPAASRERT